MKKAFINPNNNNNNNNGNTVIIIILITITAIILLLLPCLMMYYIVFVFAVFWCPCKAINVSVQYNGALLPDIILLTQCYYHRRTRLNAMKRFCICSL